MQLMILLSSEVSSVLLSQGSVLTLNFLAGTAGSVVASRLTENSACSVLIIEAGTPSVMQCPTIHWLSFTRSDENVLDIEVPFLSSSLLSPSSLTWNYSTVAQEGLDDRTISYVRGKVFGGSSSTSKLMVSGLNSMILTGMQISWDTLAAQMTNTIDGLILQWTLVGRGRT